MIKKETSTLLTQREKQILELISNGYVAKQAAEKLCLSTNTIETVKKNICQKLKAKNTPHAIKIALKSGDLIF
ncbi:MAG: helix-turn-helix transcriptional regulator [Salinivirgaceae bacterium]|nr:helix-turn-helix transcriptional regulator [Salinivirgaceae bacterium]